MAKKPTYEELEKRIKELAKESAEDKRAKEEVQRRVAQVELVHEVAHRVTSELELKTLFSEIVTAICDAFDYYGVMLLLVDEETNRLNMQSISGGYTDIFPKDLWLAKGEGMIGYAAATGETQLSGDVTKHPHFVRKAEEETKSELAVPIKSGQEVIGVLNLQSSQFNAFDKIDVVVMETLSDQIAVAIKNGRLYEVVQQELTERKQAEEALRESEEKYRTLFHDLADPVLIFGDEEPNTILDCNEAIVEKYGYSREEILKMILRDFHSPDELEGVIKNIQSEEFLPHEYIHIGKDGKKYFVELQFRHYRHI